MSSSEEGARAPRRRRGNPGQSSVPVTVVYYLCRSGRHLEHPHLMELRLASPNQALYLRDVICRLDALRGKGMATMYSWSCKRMYKTGFVWHDVLEDDVLLPAQGSEYVLKGSLLLPHHSSPPAALVAASPPADHDHTNISTSITRKVHCVKPTPDEETPTHSREGWTTNSSLPSPPTIKVDVEVEAQPPPHQEPQPELSSMSPSSSGTTGDRDEQAASAHSSSSGRPSSHNKPRGLAGGAPYPSGGTSSPTPPPSLVLYNKQQASIITAQGEVTQTQGTSTGRDLHNKDTGCSTGSTPTKATVTTDDKHPGRTGSFSSSTSRNGTLESLIRAEALGRRGAAAKRILEKDDDDDREAMQSLGTKLNPANLLMRLVACGSTMSARQDLPACGLMRTTHKPKYLSQHVELLPSSPVLSPLGALIMHPVTAAGARVVSESGDCGHCSGSMLQTAGKGCESGKVMSTNIKPTSSYDQYCVSEKEASVRNLDNLERRTQIISQTIKMAPCQQPKSGTLVTITTDVTHNNGEQECSNEASSKTLRRSTSKRMTDSSPRFSRVVSFHDEKEKAVKIEERLASGARVVIQSAPLLKETYASSKAM